MQEYVPGIIAENSKGMILNVSFYKNLSFDSTHANGHGAFYCIPVHIQGLCMSVACVVMVSLDTHIVDARRNTSGVGVRIWDTGWFRGAAHPDQMGAKPAASLNHL